MGLVVQIAGGRIVDTNNRPAGCVFQQSPPPHLPHPLCGPWVVGGGALGESPQRALADSTFSSESSFCDCRLRSFSFAAFDNSNVHWVGLVDAIKAAAPALKYCHGKDFKEEHWSALLQGKLGLSKDVRLETLTVGHFTASLRILGAPLRGE